MTPFTENMILSKLLLNSRFGTVRAMCGFLSCDSSWYPAVGWHGLQDYVLLHDFSVTCRDLKIKVKE